MQEFKIIFEIEIEILCILRSLESSPVLKRKLMFGQAILFGKTQTSQEF